MSVTPLSDWQRVVLKGLCAASATLALVLAPAADAASRKPPRRAAAKLVEVGSVGTFTPATADPRLAAILARGAAAGASFRFTPSGSESRRAVTVAIRSRSSARPLYHGMLAELAEAVPPSGASVVNPVAYDLGVAVGWKQFSLSGDFSRIDAGVLPGSRDQMDVGVGYGRGRWTTRLSLGADHNTDNNVVGFDRTYSLNLGTSYALTHNLDLTGGVRYRSLRERLDESSDDRRDAQSVYLGTAFRF